MKKLTSQTLFEEKTNVGVQATTTFNAPGNYLAPYGKTTVYISGKGSPGNYASGGNVAGSNQYYNSPTYAPAYNNGYTYYNPCSYNPASSNSPYSYYNPSSYTPAYQYWYTYYYGGYTSPPYYNSFPYYCNTNQSPAIYPGECVPGYYWVGVAVYAYAWAPESYTPGNQVCVSGNYVPASYTPSYSVSVPGNYVPASYTPGTLVPGNTNYNPYVLGSSSSPSNVLGVTFPGGSACATAPTVSCTSTTIAYVSGGTSVSVPPGGYITIKNV